MKSLNPKLRFWILYYGGLLLFGLVVAVIMKYRQTGDVFQPAVIITAFSIFLMSALCGHLAMFLIKKARNYSQAQINKMIIPALLIFYVSCYLITLASITIGVYVWFLYSGRELSEFWPHMFKYEFNFGNASYFLWLMFFTIAFFYVLWQKSVKKEQKLREENLKYRYINLKSQVNPHFLFNSLNTLSEIVYEDAAKADHYIQNLSVIYRYVLDNEEKDLISLEDELEFVKRYFSLQKERDNDKILLDIAIQSPDNFRIIPVSLQILVENALKHNRATQENPLKIHIFDEKDSLVVSNGIQRKSTLGNSAGTGLSNLQERVKLIMGKELVVTEEDSCFIVKLPVIPNRT